MPSRDTLFLNAAAAGRLVVAMLLAANGAAYFVEHSPFAVAGMLCAIAAATCGYFACSDVAFDVGDGQKLTLAAIGLSIASAAGFLLGA